MSYTDDRATLARVLDALFVFRSDSMQLSREPDCYHNHPALLAALREALGDPVAWRLQKDAYEREKYEAVARARREAIEECHALARKRATERSEYPIPIDGQVALDAYADELLGALAARPEEKTST